MLEYDSQMEPPRQHFGFFEDLRNFGKIGKFLKLGFALILRHLLTDLSFIQTKLALVRPGPYLAGPSFNADTLNRSEIPK